MDVPTITMPEDEAQEKLEAYRGQVRRRADDEYEAAVKGYEALANGTPLIELSKAVQSGGFDEEGRPRLAVGRADRKQACFAWDHTSLSRWREGTEVMAQFSTMVRRTAWHNGSLQIFMPLARPQCPAGDSGWAKNGYALVPMVPADIRTQAKGQLKDYFILWEVEQWADRSFLAEPDRDPLLLQHLIGDLYAVIAEWDLTDLERAVMSGRREE